MTIEEKLTHFYDTSVEEARRQAEKDVQEHKDSLDAALEEHKKMSLENAASSRRAASSKLRRGCWGLGDSCAREMYWTREDRKSLFRRLFMAVHSFFTIVRHKRCGTRRFASEGRNFLRGG